MKAVILAGGLGTRISEETHLKPKPMVEIGGKPVLWHILKIYSSHGIEVIDRIEGDGTLWEQEPLKGLAADGQLTAYHHHGFWQPMDTLRDRLQLEELWAQGRAPGKVW